MPAPDKTVLILGGTREAAEVAERLANRPGTRVISSLAGRTREPKPIAGESRVGGFGGVGGLMTYLAAEKVSLVIDATHPFAKGITANAGAAAASAGVPLLRLVRPVWQAEPADNWVRVGSLDAAADAVPAGARALLALGSQHLAAFAGRDDADFIVRMVDPPRETPPLVRYDLIIGKPSDDPGEEAALFRRRAVTHLVCRNSGGTGAFAKLIAARDLGLPVIMIERPPANLADNVFATVDELIAVVG